MTGTALGIKMRRGGLGGVAAAAEVADHPGNYCPQPSRMVGALN
jgi:hypothetical protein